jgi:hypothetical protein
MTGLNKFDDKRRREMRRKNHIALDLRTPKYKPRVVKPKNKDDYENWTNKDWLQHLTDEDI